jgi:hypothetical protein
MAPINQAELQRSMKLLIKNGRLPEAQAVIANIGYDLAELDRAEGLLDGWLNHQRQTEVLKRQQVEATAGEEKASGKAEIEVRKFKRVAHAVFKNNDPLLISLGLKVRRRSTSRSTEADSSTAATAADTQDIDENGRPVDSDQPTAAATTETSATATPTTDTSTPTTDTETQTTTTETQTTTVKRPSTSASAKMARWRKLFANALNLVDEERGELARAGWPDSRLQASLALVEAYIEADQIQHQRIRAFRAEEKLAVKGGQTARDWYERAIALIDVAIEDADPDDGQQLRQLFGRG